MDKVRSQADVLIMGSGLISACSALLLVLKGVSVIRLKTQVEPGALASGVASTWSIFAPAGPLPQLAKASIAACKALAIAADSIWSTTVIGNTVYADTPEEGEALTRFALQQELQTAMSVLIEEQDGGQSDSRFPSGAKVAAVFPEDLTIHLEALERQVELALNEAGVRSVKAKRWGPVIASYEGLEVSTDVGILRSRRLIAVDCELGQQSARSVATESYIEIEKPGGCGINTGILLWADFLKLYRAKGEGIGIRACERRSLDSRSWLLRTFQRFSPSYRRCSPIFGQPYVCRHSMSRDIVVIGGGRPQAHAPGLALMATELVMGKAERAPIAFRRPGISSGITVEGCLPPAFVQWF